MDTTLSIKLSSIDISTYSIGSNTPAQINIYARNGARPTRSSNYLIFNSAHSQGASSTTTVYINSTDYYDHFIICLMSTSSYTQVTELTLHGTYLDTPPDYTHAWASRYASKYIIKY